MELFSLNGNPFSNFPGRSARTAIAAIVSVGLITVPVRLQAQTLPPSLELNPLEMTEPDPLLPDLAVDRPLSPQEQGALSIALDELQKRGEANYARGDVAGAFEIWTRELRLRRYLGVEQEVASLTRVGEVAWQENQRLELYFITLRLTEIEQQVMAQTPTDYDLLLKIAKGYEKIRAREQAIVTYQQLLTQANQDQDTNRAKNILKSLGDLHLAWFDYANAATAYEELRSLSQRTNDPRTEREAIEQLAYVYQENEQLELAIIAQEQLLDVYRTRRQLEQIPAVQIQIADNYLVLDRADLAASNYQEAFTLARRNEQYGYASDALRKLAKLYESIDRLDDALVVYQLLVDIEQQSYSSYGMMEAYDQIGQIYRIQGATAQAIAAFQQGLQLARDLEYNEDYFLTQIQTLQGQPPTP